MVNAINPNSLEEFYYDVPTSQSSQTIAINHTIALPPLSGQYSTNKPTVLIISDVNLFRNGIAFGLEQIGEMHILDSVCSNQALAAIFAQSPDMIILDVSRPDAHKLSRQLRDRDENFCIIGFGIGNSDEVIACAEAGLSAFVGQNSTIEELNEVALKALQGELVCNPKITAQLVRHIALLAEHKAPVHDARLTCREEEVAGLVERGLSNKEIAIKLGISPATVKNHVHMILEKLNVGRRAKIGKPRLPYAMETSSEYAV